MTDPPVQRSTVRRSPAPIRQSCSIAALVAALLVLLLVLVPAAASGADAGAVAERWAPPLGRALEVSGPFVAPVHRYAAGHRGIDLVATAGEAVLAPASGTVTFAGAVVDRGVVSIRIDERTIVSLEPVSVDTVAGTEVRRGQRIGSVSPGGHCAAECLHVGVRVEGAYVNPMRFFANRPVLLPWDDG